MLPKTVQPGARLVDRYLLEEHVGQAGQTAYWRARDELLDRPVGVCVLSDEPARAEEILHAARRAAAVSDPRFLRILDANESDGVVYVVNEWVQASSLAELLEDGPLPADEARALTLEVAQALAAASSEDLSHLCLHPDNVLRTSHGQVKISGLAVDAAVRGIAAPDAGDADRLDTRGCAAILYAALTGRWPDDSSSSLPPAPRENGTPCSPRQVRAGIPHDLDELATRGLDASGSGRAIRTLEEMATLLSAGQSAERTRAIPVPVDRTEALRPPATDLSEGAGSAAYGSGSPARRGGVTRLAWIGALLVLLLGVGLAGYQLATGAFDSPGGDGDGTPASAAPQQPAGDPLRVVEVGTLDPPPGGNGEENTNRAARVIDGETSTQWTTKEYEDPFGPNGLKDGVGLVLDLGREQSVSSVEVLLGAGSTDLELRFAENRGEAVDDYRVAARVAQKSGRTELRSRSPIRARYLLLWFTSLPGGDGSGYRGTVSEVVVRG